MRSIVIILALASIGLSGCDLFGKGDNAPTLFDSDETRAERNERRTASPGAQIAGKMYRVVNISIDGHTSAPAADKRAVVTLDEGRIKGFDGCTSFVGRGIFTPSGYEYTTTGSKTEPFEQADTHCSDIDRFQEIYKLEGRVWSLSLEPDGLLTMTEYEKGKHVFLLRPVTP